MRERQRVVDGLARELQGLQRLRLVEADAALEDLLAGDVEEVVHAAGPYSGSSLTRRADEEPVPGSMEISSAASGWNDGSVVYIRRAIPMSVGSVRLPVPPAPMLPPLTTVTLLALDHAACVSLLVSQPVVAAAIFGALLGQFETGVAAGCLVQLVWMVPLPVGGARLPEAWFGGAAAAAAAPAWGGGDWLAATTWTPAVVVGVAAALIASPLLGLQRRWQAQRAAAAVAAIEAGRFAAASRAQHAALAMHALRGAVLGMAALTVAPRAASALAGPLTGIAIAWLVLPLAVIALGRNAPPRRVPWWVAGAVVGGVVAWWGGRA